MAETFCTMSALPAQLWQAVLGHLASLERLVPHSRLRMRSLQWHLKTHWSPESDPPSLPVPLSWEVREDLSWWMVKDHLLKGVRFGTPAPDLHLYSDASRSGWGAYLFDQVVSGVWSEQEKLLHINFLEMKALFLAVAVISGVGRWLMCDRDVRQLDGDGLRQQAGRDGFLFPFLVGQPASEVGGESRHPPQCQVSPRAVQCSGRSPQSSGSGYRDRVGPHPRVARDLLCRWGSSSIDLLATGYNAKLPYCSLDSDPQAVFEDVFRHPWGNLDLYAFPPFPLVGRVVA